MTCNVMGLKYNYKLVDLEKGEHREEAYLKLNPQRVIPTIVDGDYVLSESRPCATYLASKFAEDDKLYPKDLEVRSRVDQRLYFDMGSFYSCFGQCVYPMMFGAPKPDETTFKKFDEVLAWANDFVKPTGYVAGTDHMTLADISFLATYSTVKATGYFDLEKYEDLNAWFEKIKGEVPEYESANGQGATDFGSWFKNTAGQRTDL